MSTCHPFESDAPNGLKDQWSWNIVRERDSELEWENVPSMTWNSAVPRRLEQRSIQLALLPVQVINL